VCALAVHNNNRIGRSPKIRDETKLQLSLDAKVESFYTRYTKGVCACGVVYCTSHVSVQRSVCVCMFMLALYLCVLESVMYNHVSSSRAIFSAEELCVCVCVCVCVCSV